MWKTVFDKDYILYMIAVILFWGLLSEFLIALRYKRLIKESENMGLTKLKVLKQIKIKFENTYKLHMGINNSSIFIDKYMLKNKWMGVSLLNWNQIPLESFLLALVLSMFSVIIGYYEKIEWENLIKCPILCLMGGLLLYFFWEMINIPNKTDMLKTNILDYLENSLAYRLTSECALTQTLSKSLDSSNPTEEPGEDKKKNPDRSEDIMLGIKKEIKEEIRSMKQQINSIEKERENKNPNNEEEIIEDIIKEFLT